ncbi:porin [Alkalimonas amylolytica]|uniref:Outer membrane insertion C-terminal signal n=1 Tax=Alkalimonas amylolytica TaxID=152573 RepID=A0A1H3X509_ALKAM|nr:porin [Alkalimonas amylolytica]SDZ94495.1 outer membrane insertion C-terminal signal [Alkalimonas amylolytica]
MKKSILAISLVSVLCSGVASANVHMNGFASIKGGMSTASDKSLYGYTNEWDFKNESLFAIQVRSDLGDRLSVTAQLMGRGSNDFDARFEWAFLTYELSDTMRINAGRLRTPFYRFSDFMDVGFAYDWLRVPQGVYGLGFNNLEGLSLYRTTQLGEFDSTLQLLLGSFSGNISLAGNPARADINNIAGVTWELERGWWSVRTAYLSGKVSIDAPGLAPLFSGLTQAGVPDLVSALDFNDDQSQFIGLGITMDQGEWVLISEYNRINVKNSFFAKRENYYLSVGYRFDSITPFVSFEREDHRSKSDIYQPYTPLLPAQLLQPVIAVVESQSVDTKTWNAGLRYDFHPAAAFKIQYSNEKNTLTDNRSDLVAVGVDIVF